MSRSGKKPRQKKLDPKAFEPGQEANKKKERDWTFDDIVRSKSRYR